MSRIHPIFSFLAILFLPAKQIAQNLDFHDSSSYYQKRRLLIDLNSQYASNYKLELNADEKIVDQKLQGLRKSMLKDYRQKGLFPPARYFYSGQADSERTLLFQHLKKMPKGGLLHTHSVALGDFRWIVEQVAKHPNCYVFWADDNADFVKGQIHFYKAGKEPQGFELGSELAKSKPNFKKELLDLLTLDQNFDAAGFPIWIEFENIFKRLGGFINYEPIFKPFYINTFNNLIADGVQHVEIRELLYFGLYDLEHPNGYFPSDTIVQYYRDLEKTMRKKQPAFTLKLIYTSLRFLDYKTVFPHLEDAYRLRKANPDFVKGFDLVAEEDAGHTSAYFLPLWLKMDSLEKIYGIDMPLYLHGGESNWLFEDNLYDLILLNTKRIGHGFNLFRFPKLQELVRQKDICLEINPLSNQILGYIRDLRMHPATYYLTQNIPISISSDDPGVFGYVGVTPDYWAIWLAWNLDLGTLKKIILNSITYSSLSAAEKVVALTYWQKAWDKFIADLAKN